MVNFVSPPSPSHSRIVPSPYFGWRTSEPSFHRARGRGEPKFNPEARFGRTPANPRLRKNPWALSAEFAAFSHSVRGFEPAQLWLSGSVSSGGTSERKRDGFASSRASRANERRVRAQERISRSRARVMP